MPFRSPPPRPDPVPWQAAAACAALPPTVVFARRAKDAAPALRACAACPVATECEEAVAPAESWFDGVCGGRLWRNGRPSVIAPSSAGPSGIPSAVPSSTPSSTPSSIPSAALQLSGSPS